MNETGEESLDSSIDTEQGEDENSTVTLLQWNTWHKADPEKVIDHLKRITEKEGIDVVCLQELPNSSDGLAAQIAEALDMPHFATAPARYLDIYGKPYARDDIGIFSRFPIESKNTKVLTEDGWRVFSEKEASQNYLEVDVTIPGTDKKITVANTHLLTPLFTRRTHRIAEANALSEIVKTHADKPYVLTGDFNAGPQSYAARKVSEVLTTSREPGTTTWTPDKWSGPKLWKRFLNSKRELDHTFVSPSVSVDSAKVLDPGPSDHSPTMTVMKI